MTDTTPEAFDWGYIPDTPEQRALIAAHNAEMKRAYSNLVDLDSLSAQLEAAEAKLKIAIGALGDCRDELDAYSHEEYPGDHPVHERYRKRDYDSNTARLALRAIAGDTDE